MDSGYGGTFVVAIVLVIAVTRFRYSWLLPKPLPDIPHDPITSILGHIPDIAAFVRSGKGSDNDWFHGQPLKHGPISQFFLGRTRIVVLFDRKELERLLLRTKSTEQSTWVIESFGTIIPYGQLAQPTNERWKMHRQLTGPSMSQRYLERMSTRVSAEANSLVRLWKRKIELVGDRSFDAGPDVKLAIVDTMRSITLGDDTGYVDVACISLPSSLISDANPVKIPQVDPPPLHRAFEVLTDSVEKLQFIPLPIPLTKLFLQTLNPSWQQSYKRVCNFLNRQISDARARESGSKPGNLATDADCIVDMIAQREAREGVEKLPTEEIRDELLSFLLAGQDTTPSVISWLIKHLAQDMELQQRLHNEICELFGQDLDEDELLDYKKLNDTEKVSLLEAVIAETLRCGWVIPNLMRELNQDEVILGHHLPKGTHLMYPVGPLGTQESDWGPDAKTWKPSRWLRDDGSFDGNAGPSYHFGIGQRACFGQRMAVLQLKTFVATLSRSFMFKQVPDEVGSFEVLSIAVTKPKYCYVSLERWPAL